MKKKNRCRNNNDDISALIGEELVCEILSKLPAKTLLRFKSVCKRWRFLIQQDSCLHNLHLTQSKTHPSLIISIAKDYEIDFLSPENLFEGGAALPWLTTSWSEPMLRPVNGLLCLVEMFGNVVRIFNPTTREITPSIRTIMDIEVEENGVLVRPLFGFGCDVFRNEHKVICMWEILRTSAEREVLGVERVCEVMTVGENTWRRIDAVPPYNIQGSPINVNGVIFCLNAGRFECEAPDCNALVAFDVARERFSVIKIPYHVLGEPKSIFEVGFVYLVEVDGRLAILHRRTGDGKVKLWIMDGVEIITNANTNTNASNWIEETISMPFDWDGNQYLTFRPIPETDQIIIKPEEPSHSTPRNSISLYYYNRTNKTSRKVEITGIDSLMHYPFCYALNIFVESLLPVQKKQQQQEDTQPPPGKLKQFS